MTSISGKRILLVVPKFAPLDSQIMNELEIQGAYVEIIYDQCQKFNPNFIKSSFRIIRKCYYKLNNLNIKYHSQFDQWDKEWDYLLCINGWSIDPILLKKIKTLNPNIKCILYLWDSLKTFRFNCLFPFFDKVYTFDYQDSIKYNIDYLPLFWVENKNGNHSEIKYDLSFIGKLHSDRYEVIKKIEKYCRNNGINYYFKIIITNRCSNIIEYIKHLLFKLKNRGQIDYRYDLLYGKIIDPIISFNYVDPIVAQNIINASRCIIDIEIPEQSGLTNRTIQGLGYQKKIITTNFKIKNDVLFQNNPNIIVIDRYNPIINTEAISQNYSSDKPNNTILEKLRIDNWIKIILNMKKINDMIVFK